MGRVRRRDRDTVSSRALEFLIPGDLQTGTGGYVYDRRIIGGFRALNWTITVHALDASFPHPTVSALDHAHDVLASLPDQALVMIDGLALGAMPRVVRTHSARLALVGLIHMPLGAEGGWQAGAARRLKQSEFQALRAARRVVVTSRSCREILLVSGIAPERVSVVEPGTDAAPLATRCGDPVRLLCVATVNAGKGYELLIEALAPLAPLRWHLTCVGSLTRSPKTVERLRAQLQRTGLAERVTLVGEVKADEVARFYLGADLFVLPTRFESYGMAVAEAVACGLPVISTRTGAIPELVGANAGLLVDPDVASLREALQRVLSDPVLRASLGRGATIARGTLPRWPAACTRMADILEDVRTSA
jgi:glycosyltransferase involved in cell wall biosynthesis